MLATRCPNCHTLFKVTSGQLQLHAGEVRCGHCQHVFSGIDHLTAADADSWERLALEDATPSASNAPNQTPTELPLSAPPNRLTKVWAKGAIQTWNNAGRPLQLACISLMIMLVLQTLWWQRVPLIQLFGPPLISSQSTWLSKTFAVPPTSALVVEGSGLQPLDENTLRIDLTWRNANPLPSQWPHVKVELLDSQGLPLASKTLGLGDYQQRDGKPAANLPPIAPAQTVEALAYLNIKALNTQLPDTAITGFRVELFDATQDFH